MTRRSAIGRRLRSGREALGLTLRALESKSGVSSALISQIETERVKNPGVKTIAKLARALKCSDASWLAFGE